MSGAWKKLKQTEQRVSYKWVTTKTFLMPDGQTAEFTTWHKMGSRNATTIALTQDNQVIVARQYRAGCERLLEELPGGGVDDGEELSIAAARELQEETGYVTDEAFVYLGTGCRDAYSNETDHYFLALNCAPTASQELDEGEYVEVALISINRLIDNAKSGMMSDSVAVLLAYDKLQELNTHATSN